MPSSIPPEKIEEIIALAEEAQWEPCSSILVVRPAPSLRFRTRPSVPQPLTIWRRALQRRLANLPEQALKELFAAYWENGQKGRNEVTPLTHDARVGWLSARPDLAPRLKKALPSLA